MTRSKLGASCVDLCKFLKKLWPLTRVRISFPPNILRMTGWNLTKLSICFNIDDISHGIVIRKIWQIYN